VLIVSRCVVWTRTGMVLVAGVLILRAVSVIVIAALVPCQLSGMTMPISRRSWSPWRKLLAVERPFVRGFVAVFPIEFVGVTTGYLGWLKVGCVKPCHRSHAVEGVADSSARVHVMALGWLWRLR